LRKWRDLKIRLPFSNWGISTVVLVYHSWMLKSTLSISMSWKGSQVVHGSVNEGASSQVLPPSSRRRMVMKWQRVKKAMVKVWVENSGEQEILQSVVVVSICFNGVGVLHRTCFTICFDCIKTIIYVHELHIVTWVFLSRWLTYIIPFKCSTGLFLYQNISCNWFFEK